MTGLFCPTHRGFSVVALPVVLGEWLGLLPLVGYPVDSSWSLCLCEKNNNSLTKAQRTQRITLPETLPPISVSTPRRAQLAK